MELPKNFMKKLNEVKQLIELVEQSGIGEIELKNGNESIRISKAAPTASTTTEYRVPATTQSITPPPATEPESTEDKKDNIADKHTVNSPMVGTIYLAPTPGAKPFVEVGQTIKKGDVLCLVEAMKMYNQIEADRDGTLTARLIDNGSPVEFDQPLFIVE
jgi:acetyl-CoA carboxylase biotin carboxyl carrier protein